MSLVLYQQPSKYIFNFKSKDSSKIIISHHKILNETNSIISFNIQLSKSMFTIKHDKIYLILFSTNKNYNMVISSDFSFD